jgi:hypothetical protein
MAVTVTDNRTALYSDGLTNITGASTAVTSFFAEAASCAGEAYNTTTGQIYWSGTTPNFTTTGNECIYIWSAIVATQNGYKEATATDSSHAIYLSDGADDLLIYQAGNDRDVFKHADGQVSFQCFLIDIDYLDTVNTNGDLAVTAGTYAGFDKTSTSMDVGAHYTTLSKALGGGQNCYLDMIRYGGADEGINIAGGTTGDRGNFAEAAVEDRATADGKAHGIIREYTTGAYGVQGTLHIGDDGTGTSYFEEDGFTVTFEDRLVSDDKYKLFFEGNSTGTNVIRLSGGSIASARPGVSIDASSSNINELLLDGVTFSALLNAITFPSDTNGTTLDHDVVNCVFENCGIIDIGTVAFTGNSVNNTNGTTAITKSLDGTDSTTISNNSFSTTGTDHAITVTGTVETLNITDCDFSGYAATNGSTGGETLYVNIATGSMTVNVSGGSGNFSVRTAGATVTVVSDPATTKVTAEDQGGNVIENVRVLLETADNGGGGGLPYQASVSTLTQTGGTATLTASSAHGLSTNDYVVVRGASDEYYNKTAQITVTSTTAFTYSVNTSAAASAGGTPVFSYAPLSGLTDSNGVIQSSKSWPASQGLKGWARKSTSSPLYKQSPISVADASGGTDLVVLMIEDE